MERYVIFKETSETNREYVEYIYRTSVSYDKDIGDAIEFDNKRLALDVARYLEKRAGNVVYKVLAIKTTMEIID